MRARRRKPLLPRRTKMLKRIAAAVLVTALALALGACGKDISSIDADIPALIENGRNVELLVYGDGLAVDPTQKNPLRDVYELVDDERVSDKQSFTDEMEKYFTSAQTAVICVAAFEGVNEPEGIIRARYVFEEGKLYADSEFEFDMKIRTPDYDTIKLKRANKYLAEITIDMICEDGTVENTLITLKNEDGVWKLDSSVM